MSQSKGSRLLVVGISNTIGLPRKVWPDLLQNGLDVTTVDF